MCPLPSGESLILAVGKGRCKLSSILNLKGLGCLGPNYRKRPATSDVACSVIECARTLYLRMDGCRDCEHRVESLGLYHLLVWGHRMLRIPSLVIFNNRPLTISQGLITPSK